MSESIYVDDDSQYESILETQAPPQISNLRRRPVGHKKAKELKRKAVVKESSQDDKELKEIMRSYKDCMIENKDLKVMFKETATIQTPAKRRWVQQKQADIIEKSSSRLLNFEDEVYRLQPPEDDDF
ncbi:hypothetical protein L3X38_017255 [Prunus dulcis]|uniref:Uncharacterized protein n=1 Tax=Prunus dulcis TaxID=3755 RepID=A0AAD4W8G2_PRUDU|nr:hypothetical protein L3X38_017255 [Prunus dulcis]